MVQINEVAIPDTPLLHQDSELIVETMEGAVNPSPMPSGQEVQYIKWDTSHLVKI